ncbi:cytidine deaminase [Zunongwangia sp.]|uniref:cytidine deaminase n=1 Tax=Zunongwangia sp. TaxID=1965325 RepID=UPI003AA97892
MKEINFSAVLKVYDSIEELPEDVQNLVKEAISARNNAYAPYSRFKVGAALLTEDNDVVIGSNQENASYPSGLCAERTAIYYAGARFPEKVIKTIVITAKASDKILTSPIPPCGACRQALVEYEVKQQSPVAVYFMGEEGQIYKVNSVRDLLPFIFDKASL